MSLALLILAGLFGPPADVPLTLDFRLQEARGEVFYAVYADENRWRARQGPVASGRAPASSPQTRVSLALPAGRYAVMAFHDVDSDGRLDTLPIGLPTEPYGFSNNARGTFGPPAWRQATFGLTTGGARQVIRLR